MTTLGPYEVHPVADMFPLVEGEEFDELVQDIKTNGLLDPVVVSNDRRVLIDGRNRWRACLKAGVEVAHQAVGVHYSEDMIVNLIVSKNLKRRQLNRGQVAMLGADIKKHVMATVRRGAPVGNQNALRGESEMSRAVDSKVADPPPLIPAKSREVAAKIVGASGRSVQHAEAVERDAPDLAVKVRSGEVALDAAYKQARQRAKSQPQPEPAPKPSPILLQLKTHDGRAIEYPKPQAKPSFNETKGDGISWASWSWNPVTGCLHGCNYCYARGIATDDRFKQAYPAGFTPLYHEERLTAPANTTIPERHKDDPSYKRVFVCSMADLYGRWVPLEWIDSVHDQMLSNPQWEYLLLTKFPDRFKEVKLPPTAWVGTSVDEQKRVRIAERAFRQIDDVKVKWLSLEPLNEPLEFSDLSMFDWVVIGAQTETRQPDGVVPAFQPPWQWVINITKQAMDAGCKVHWKPNLRSAPGMVWPDEYPES